MKGIRFNLRFFNGNGSFDSVRSLSELQDKFNLDDLYEYFVSGQLELWLKCHSEDAVAEEVSALASEKDVHRQIAGLFDALGFDFDYNEKESVIWSYLFPQEFLKRRAAIANSVGKVAEVVKKDFADYNDRIKSLVKHHEDLPAVKAEVRDLLEFHG